MKHPVRLCCILSLGAYLYQAAPLSAAQLDVLEVPGTTLQDNPLKDPALRRLAIFTPADSKAEQPLPLIVYLPGWGGSSEDAIRDGRRSWFHRVVDQLKDQGLPLRLAVVDGRSRYGGSQFLNSTATGNYADYISEEIVPLLKSRYPGTGSGAAPCVIAGHSSGGYGALILASRRQSRFQAVVALSPDSDFETTHKPLVQNASVQRLTAIEVAEAMAAPKEARQPADGLAALVVGLSANYTPSPEQPGKFEWLYTATGQWRPAVWQRWLDQDPLTLVRSNASAYSPQQRIYLDGAERDEFGANIGARKIFQVLRSRSSPVLFYESPGSHSDRLPERLVKGVKWVLGTNQPQN